MSFNSPIFMFHISKAFYLHMGPVFHCTSSPKWYSPSPFTRPLLASNLAFLHKYLLALLPNIVSGMFSCLLHRHTHEHRCQHLWEARWECGNSAGSEGLEKACTLEAFLSTASSLFTENSLVLQEWTLPWAWSAFKFPAVCEHGWPSSQHSHGDALPLVHIMPVLQWHNCEPLSLVGPSAPIIEPCKPAMTFTLTSSALHSSEALPFRAT